MRAGTCPFISPFMDKRIFLPKESTRHSSLDKKTMKNNNNLVQSRSQFWQTWAMLVGMFASKLHCNFHNWTMATRILRLFLYLYCRQLPTRKKNDAVQIFCETINRQRYDFFWSRSSELFWQIRNRQMEWLPVLLNRVKLYFRLGRLKFGLNDRYYSYMICKIRGRSIQLGNNKCS